MKYAFAFPLLPGKEDQARAVTAELLGARRSQFDELQRRTGVIEEAYFLQISPEGSMVIVVGEGSTASLADTLDPDNHEIDRYLLDMMIDLSGVDPRSLGDAPPAELMGEWKA